MALALTFEDDGTGHDDLVLRLGDFSRRCDSYYLALDQRILAGREDASKVRGAEVEGWSFLPSDFSAYAMSVPGFRRDAGPWAVITEAFAASILRFIDAAA